MHPKLLLIALVLLAGTVACSRALKTDSKDTQQQAQKEDTPTAATKAWRAEQSRRIWRRTLLRQQLKNDELDLSNAQTENRIAELEGRPQTATPTILANARLLSDNGALQMDDLFDEMDQNLAATGADPYNVAENIRERVEIDELCDQWDTRIRAVKTVREANLATSAMAKAIEAKLGEFQDRAKDAIQRAQRQQQRSQPSNAGK